jgi:hypothetical protein
LVLRLHLKNTSRDVAFKPMDPFFDRKWKQEKGKTDVGMPFTYLSVGSQRFFGGPIEWKPRAAKSSSRVQEPVQTLEGQDYGTELKPGDAMDTFVCTDPDDPEVKRALAGYRGGLTWRVLVRRGLVEVPNKGEHSACAVVGVTFRADDIHRPAVE